ncbi:hypothetical protein WJX72_007956 [[Myrmecia] bisecta]|uniref:Threonine aspartase n=1 Tax=[Myrmecia] bisecta TaxID=41462 RepID=A0AAW1PDD8_9CHLO
MVEGLPFFVAVHVGAGFHARKLDPAYKAAMKQACQRAAELLKAGADCMDAVAAAIKVLEDCAETNAGLGSNLTEGGSVEGDASIMHGDGRFGAVGAVPGVRNPIVVASSIAEESQQALPLGRVRPIFLAGDKARQWARQRGLEAAPSAEDAGQWNAWQEDALQHDARLLNDTVGCICVDAVGRVASGVSSGGIAMKTDGRIGEAAIRGNPVLVIEDWHEDRAAFCGEHWALPGVCAAGQRESAKEAEAAAAAAKAYVRRCLEQSGATPTVHEDVWGFTLASYDAVRHDLVCGNPGKHVRPLKEAVSVPPLLAACLGCAAQPHAIARTVTLVKEGDLVEASHVQFFESAQLQLAHTSLLAIAAEVSEAAVCRQPPWFGAPTPAKGGPVSQLTQWQSRTSAPEWSSSLHSLTVHDQLVM